MYSSITVKDNVKNLIVYALFGFISKYKFGYGNLIVKFVLRGFTRKNYLIKMWKSKIKNKLH